MAAVFPFLSWSNYRARITRAERAKELGRALSLEVDNAGLEGLASAWWLARWLRRSSRLQLDSDALEGSTSVSTLPLLALGGSGRSAIERS